LEKKVERLLSTTQQAGSVALVSIWAYQVINFVESTMNQLTKTVSTWRTRNRDRIYLAKMNDRLLRDIGMTRTEAENEANKYFWQN
jgi:uncharacterized protein YjiS (DUF1127 family)